MVSHGDLLDKFTRSNFWNNLKNKKRSLKKNESKEDIIITHTTYPHWDKYIQKAKGLVVAYGDEFSRCSENC